MDTTNLEVTTIKAKDGTAAANIANTSGVITLSQTMVGDIQGETRGSGTQLTSSSDLNSDLASGRYFWNYSDEPANAPITTGVFYPDPPAGYVLRLRVNSLYAYDICFQDAIYFRINGGGVWGSWESCRTLTQVEDQIKSSFIGNASVS